MSAYFFLCPITGLDVQGFLVEETPDDDPDSYMSVRCLTCGQMHSVHFKTGNTAGEWRLGVFIHGISVGLPN